MLQPMILFTWRSNIRMLNNGLTKNKMVSESGNDLPSDLLAAMNNLEGTLLDCESILKRLTEVPLQDSKNKLEPLEKAKLDLTATYAINSLFWIYLVTQGVNVADHPVKHELERVKKYMGKIKDTEEKIKGAAVKLDKQAAKRFISSALWTPKEKAEESEAIKVDETESQNSKPAPESTKKQKRKVEDSPSTKKQKKKKKKVKHD